MKKTTNQIKEIDKKHYMNVFGERTPVAFSHGKGVYLYSLEGDAYMDLLGGIAVNCLGHGNAKLTKAIEDQAKKLIHCSSLYYIPVQAELAQKLVEKTFADRVFFCNSGAEANEAAIKLARAYYYKKGAPRSKVVSALQSFHGRTLMTATATGQEKYSKPFAPLPEGFVHIPYNDISAMESEIDEQTCAVILELIQGESGVIPAEKNYIQAVAALCKKKGVLFILDEVQTGIGRTGTLFCYEQYGVAPDIITSAKGLAGGVPIGAVLATEDAAAGFTPGDHGSTFGGNPLATAAALAVLDEIDNEKLLNNTVEIGEFLQKKLMDIQKKNSIITDIRGKGLLIGIELSIPVAAEIKQKLFQKGFLVGSIGSHIIRLAPPLILKKSEASDFLSVFEEILGGNYEKALH